MKAYKLGSKCRTYDLLLHSTQDRVLEYLGRLVQWIDEPCRRAQGRDIHRLPCQGYRLLLHYMGYRLVGYISYYGKCMPLTIHLLQVPEIHGSDWKDSSQDLLVDNHRSGWVEFQSARATKDWYKWDTNKLITCCRRRIWAFLMPSCFATKGNAAARPAQQAMDQIVLIV